MATGEWSPPSFSLLLCFLSPVHFRKGATEQLWWVDLTRHLVSCQVNPPPSTPKSCTGLLLIHSPPVCPDTEACPDPCAVLGLGHAEFNEVHTGPLLKPIKVPRDGIPSTKCINCTAGLSVTRKLAKGALNSTMSLIKVLNRTSPNKVPTGTPLDTDPFGHWEVDCNSGYGHPASSLSIEWPSHQILISSM